MCKQDRKEKTLLELSDERTQKIGVVRHFLNTIRPIIKESKTFMHINAEGKKQILWDTLYFEDKHIGWVDNMNYLLDCHFVYKEIVKTAPKHYDTPTEIAYYLKLFRIGAIKPYKSHFNPLLVTNEGGKFRCFFAISSLMVNIDASTLDLF